jgi:ubiquitin-protein ligase
VQLPVLQQVHLQAQPLQVLQPVVLLVAEALAEPVAGQPVETQEAKPAASQMTSVAAKAKKAMNQTKV